MGIATLLLTTVLPALVPAISGGIRAVVNKLTGGAGAQPVSVDEVVKLSEAETARLEAMAKLDAVGETYRWVNAIRALMRPMIGAVILGLYAYLRVKSDASANELEPFARSVISYFLGDRTYMYLMRKEGTKP